MDSTIDPIIGWYYLHTNGSLIFKRSICGIDPAMLNDFDESDFVRTYWPVAPAYREYAWVTVIEAWASKKSVSYPESDRLGERVEELIQKWSCTNDDAVIFANRIGINLKTVEESGKFYVQHNNTHTPYRIRAIEALVDLWDSYGYRPTKPPMNMIKVVTSRYSHS